MTIETLQQQHHDKHYNLAGCSLYSFQSPTDPALALHLLHPLHLVLTPCLLPSTSLAGTWTGNTHTWMGTETQRTTHYPMGIKLYQLGMGPGISPTPNYTSFIQGSPGIPPSLQIPPLIYIATYFIQRGPGTSPGIPPFLQIPPSH